MRASKKKKKVKSSSKLWKLSKPKQYEKFTVRIPIRLYRRWTSIPETQYQSFPVWVLGMMEVEIKRAGKFFFEGNKRIRELLPDKEKIRKQDKNVDS